MRMAQTSYDFNFLLLQTKDSLCHPLYGVSLQSNSVRQLECKQANICYFLNLVTLKLLGNTSIKGIVYKAVFSGLISYLGNSYNDHEGFLRQKILLFLQFSGLPPPRHHTQEKVLQTRKERLYLFRLAKLPKNKFSTSLGQYSKSLLHLNFYYFVLSFTFLCCL